MLEQAGLDVTGDAATNAEAAEAEVLLLAGDAPVDEGASHAAVVLLSDDERQASALQGLGLRGWALLPPDASADLLITAVQAVAQGLALVAAAHSRALLGRDPVQVADTLLEPLTARELEVLQLVSQGLSNKMIARQLGISEHTVKFHVSSTYAKLDAANRTEAVSHAARRGLITL